MVIETEELTIDDNLRVELESSQEDVLSCQGSGVVVESSNIEQYRRVRRKKLAKKIESHQVCNNIPLLRLTIPFVLLWKIFCRKWRPPLT